MNRSEFLAALAALPLAQAQPSPAVPGPPAGDLVLQPFATAPFPHPSRAGGHTYEGVLYDAARHYSDPTVGIYLPPGYVRRATVDFVVHFHGWRNHVSAVLDRYRLPQQLAQSQVNAVLLVPQGPYDAPDSGDGKLENDPNGFARFIDEAMAFLKKTNRVAQPARLGNIVLSAHSGGYAGAGGVLTHGGRSEQISDVLLFDALYAYFDAFAAWEQSSPEKHLVSIFTPYTAKNNEAMQARLGATQLKTPPPLGGASRKPVFLYTTDVAHDEIMQKYNWFELFLQTTALQPR